MPHCSRGIPEHGYRAAFLAAASVLGMQPKRSTPWTEAGWAAAAAIAANLGPYPSPAAGAGLRGALRRAVRGLAGWLRGIFRTAPQSYGTGAPPPELPTVPDALAPSLLALRTLSPIVRIESAAGELAAYDGWAELWPGFRRLVEAPEAVTVRQELVSRLGLRLSTPALTDSRLAAALELLTTLSRVPHLNREDWLDFVAALVAATLAVAEDGADRDPLRWRRWTQEAERGRSLAYWTGRLARLAEDLAAGRDAHAYPKLVWRWRDIARAVLVPWLDAYGYSALCLGHWLEGLLADSDTVPRLTVGRRACGFGLADIVYLWKRSGEADPDLPFNLDHGMATALQEALASCRARLAALPAMQSLMHETRHFDIRPKALPSTAPDRPKLADLVRYAASDTADPTGLGS